MVYRCKMCGAVLQISGETITECEYCGAQQTVSKSTDEVITNLFDRANNLRLRCEFDKAEQIYEKILDIDNTDAEAHWGVVLCKYGIEYVEDPKTFKRIPTCHRTLYDAVTIDVNYISAIENADALQKAIYEQEAKAIDKLQKDILSIVNDEEPFDVFICYKETDEKGKRTPDSVITNDIYYQLTQEGFKVFYAPITLEDKLGQEYEPYIFAALNSAKVMLVVGTKPEYFDAVWVRNEWFRYLKLLKIDRSRLLIPCYRDMDAYDLPEEFAHLQCQDMSKIGFMSDVIRGIKKIVSVNAKNENTIHTQSLTHTADNNIIKSKEKNKKYSSPDSYNLIEKIMLVSSIVTFAFLELTVNSYYQGLLQSGLFTILYAFFVITAIIFPKKNKIIIISNVILTFCIGFHIQDCYSPISSSNRIWYNTSPESHLATLGIIGLILANLLSYLFVIPRSFNKNGIIANMMAIIGTICFCVGTTVAITLLHDISGYTYFSDSQKNMNMTYIICGLLSQILISFSHWPRKSKI